MKNTVLITANYNSEDIKAIIKIKESFNKQFFRTDWDKTYESIANGLISDFNLNFNLYFDMNLVNIKHRNESVQIQFKTSNKENAISFLKAVKESNEKEMPIVLSYIVSEI